ncbi:DUF3152 domain-containing protein [Streptomyces sp. ME18-1-4]|jgi:hypothetical protein|uniref:DUF3152 domain-containing protein n=1 Tax=Streptomyces sp. ME18-1-4 TaxID=3028685 RepID=UPI0029AE93D6|nr:DUF3152 domain-containing protein [Streptomyces sp. ME18-1-4]MDX3244199.1 DUF3152 domain-containing protein [Streptomyces sp. ME18-1-4]
MSVHRADSSSARRRGSGPAHSAGRGRRRPLWAGLAALALLGAAGFAAVGWTSAGAGGTSAEGRSTTSGESGGAAGSSSAPPRTATPSSTASPRTSGGPSAGSSAGSSDGSGGRSAGTSKDGIPASGPGTFTTASGSSAKVGKGTALRYRVDVEDGIKLSATDVARQVELILADRRGWTADGRSAFRRVSVGAVDFVVRVATPGTVDKICGQYGLDTGGEVNCNVDDNVMVNLKRWLLATPVYAKDVTAYRALIINHEVGHFLHHNHVGCPGPGRPAPAMMQQIKGMNGCVPNVWPYDEQGRFITGPSVP